MGHKTKVKKTALTERLKKAKAERKAANDKVNSLKKKIAALG